MSSTPGNNERLLQSPYFLQNEVTRAKVYLYIDLAVVIYVT